MRAFVSNSIWRAPIAACAIGGLLVVVFNLLSCFVLARRSYLRAAAGFGYGFMLAWALVLAFLCLMVGVVLQGFQDVVATRLAAAAAAAEAGAEAWSPLATGAFNAAFGLAYVCAALYALFFLALLVFSREVSEGLGIAEQLRAHKRAAEADAVAAGGGMGGDALGGAGPI